MRCAGMCNSQPMSLLDDWTDAPSAEAGATPLTCDQVTSIRQVALPPIKLIESSRCFEIAGSFSPAVVLPCEAIVLKKYGNYVTQLQCNVSDSLTYILDRGGKEDLFTGIGGRVKARTLLLNRDGVVAASGRPQWLRLPGSPEAIWSADTITDSWKGAISLTSRDASGTPFREPQAGALHSLAACRTLGEKKALVVMPTGTGKTEVMIAHMVMTHPSRVLVIVPSDPLRKQTAEKFLTLGVLRDIKAVTNAARTPIVGLMSRVPKNVDELGPVDRCNVVVATASALDQMSADLRSHFIDKFTLVYFDEAHHLKAASWDRLMKLVKNHEVLAFTATPYREDGRRIDLRIVYSYPLSRAQEKGYFRKIHFLEVNSFDETDADLQIARLAVERLVSDEENGYRHIILARAETKQKAEKLYEDVYSRYSDLNPVLLHSGIAKRSEIVRKVREGHHRIVVCVDMFGEGFDLSSLKIAAMHDIYRSLAITLQFTGRFTRAAVGVGDATLIANVADVKVASAIEALYAEDPDWNKLVPELSARAVQSELDFGHFLEEMKSVASLETEQLFDLNVIRPKTSTIIYRCEAFDWRNFARGMRRGCIIHKHWWSQTQDLLVVITKTEVPVDWATVRGTHSDVWDLFVLSYDSTTKLLYIHSSQKGSLHLELARAVGGRSVRICEGDMPFKVLSGLSRMVLYSVGLYGRGKLRFRMLTGLDIKEAIAPASQVGTTKSNIFGAGYEEGKRVTIGASAKGRIWSLSASTIPEWVRWCKSVGAKITDPKITTEDILSHTLIPTELRCAPVGEILAILDSQAWTENALGGAYVRLDSSNSFAAWDAVFYGASRLNDLEVEFCIRLSDEEMGFKMIWGADGQEFRVEQSKGLSAEIQFEGREVGFAEFFTEHPPVIVMLDGSEVRGGVHLKAQEVHPLTIDDRCIHAIDWTGVDIRKESRWKAGVERPNSIQAHVLSILAKGTSDVIVDDDDSGESADIVAINEESDQIQITLYHCKYSHRESPGIRVSDLYEVCGQAVRSARFSNCAKELIKHLSKREREFLNGRPTRFVKGSHEDLTRMARKLQRVKVRLKIVIVQPGLSKSAIEPNVASILGAADHFIRALADSPVVVWASR